MNTLALAIVFAMTSADDRPKGNVTPDRHEWTFRARVTDCRAHLLNARARYGVAYPASVIGKVKDGAMFVVGHDARWVVTLEIIDHGNDPFGFELLKSLKIVIHSPTRSLHTDKPENQEFDLSLRYRVNKRSEYRFTRFEVRQPEKPN